MLSSLPGHAVALIEEDVSFKATRLSAWNRYPALTLQDLIRLLVIFGLATVMSVSAWQIKRDPPVQFTWDLNAWPLGIYLALVGAQWYSLTKSLWWRREDRVHFLEKHSGHDDPVERDFMEASGSMMMFIFGLVAVLGPPLVYISALLDGLGVSRRDSAPWVALGGTLLAGLILYSASEARDHRPESQVARLRERLAQAQSREVANTSAPLSPGWRGCLALLVVWAVVRPLWRRRDHGGSSTR